MASRKTPTAPPAEAAFVVVLEDIRAQNKVFGEALASFREQVAREFDDVRREMRGDFEDVRREMRGDVEDVRGEVRGGFEQVRGEMRGGFEQVRGEMRIGFEQVDQRLGRLETDSRLIKLAVIEQGAELKKKVNREEAEALVERARLSR